MAKGYNGHPSYNAWNVSLWIANDEGLYTFAKDMIRSHKNRDDAARAILRGLTEGGTTHTPDGAPYNYTNIRRAIRDL